MPSDRNHPESARPASRIWRSVVRGPVVPGNDRDRKWEVFNTRVPHLRPIRVPEATIRYTHTFGRGGRPRPLPDPEGRDGAVRSELRQ